MEDYELLQTYARGQADDAFATLVRRHLNLVYSAALRQTREPHAAEDVTQVVFVILARKAATLSRNVILPGWLLRTTRYTASDARRREWRRANLERKAMEQIDPAEPESPSLWEQIAPLLDEALVKLSETDRNAVVLRFFEEKSFKEIGQVMGLTENTARMRVTRSIERLRIFFARRGIAVSAVALGAVLEANTVQAAPLPLTAHVLAAVTGNGSGVAAAASVVLKMLAWGKFRMALLIGVPALLFVGTATYLAPQIQKRYAPLHLVHNGDFEQGLTNWQTIFWARSEAAVTNEPVAGTEGQAVKFSITRIGLVDTFEFVQAPVCVKAGHQYTVRFRARSTVTQPIRVLLTKDKKPWTFYGFRVSAEITPRWRTYRLSGRAMVTADDGRLVFHCRGAVGEIWLDDIQFQDRGS